MFKKINIFTKFKDDGLFHYECSTNQSKTCKEAVKRFISLHGGCLKTVKANFSK